MLRNHYILQLKVSVEDIIVVKQPQTMEQMDRYFPYFDLGHHLLLIFKCVDLFTKITLLGILHHYAQTLNALVEKSLIISDNVRRIERGKQSYFV